MSFSLNLMSIVLMIGLSAGDLSLSLELRESDTIEQCRAAAVTLAPLPQPQPARIETPVVQNELRPPARIAAVDELRIEKPRITQSQVGDGFFFIEGRHCAGSLLSWNAGRLRIENPTSGMMAAATTIPSNQLNDASADCQTMGLVDIEISESQMRDIQSTLAIGGVVSVSKTEELLCVKPSEGGFEIIESIASPDSNQRKKLVDDAIERGNLSVSPTTRSWLANFRPDRDLAERASQAVDDIQNLENKNIVSANATQRLDNWSYPLTISAMLIFVVSIGSLLAVRPHELVAVAHTKSEVSVNRFLWLIAAMSAIDLVWTLLAHQANQIAEVNPVGNVMLNDPQRVIMFKCLATLLAVGILYRARHTLFARKACWWICLTLALLIGRWILVAGVSV